MPSCKRCGPFRQRDAVIRLDNGYITPSFVGFGSTIGLNAVDSERDTDNGADGDTFSRGVDGLALDTEKLHISHRYGATRAISAPKYTAGGTHHGTSVGFSSPVRLLPSAPGPSFPATLPYIIL